VESVLKEWNWRKNVDYCIRNKVEMGKAFEHLIVLIASCISANTDSTHAARAPGPSRTCCLIQLITLVFLVRQTADRQVLISYEHATDYCLLKARKKDWITSSINADSRSCLLAASTCDDLRLWSTSLIVASTGVLNPSLRNSVILFLACTTQKKITSSFSIRTIQSIN